MRMTKHTDYAIRMLLLLAMRDPELVTIQEVARTYDISKNHLMKVAHKLVQENYVRSVRGRNGGLLLARAPELINVGELVKATEISFPLVEAFHSDANNKDVPSADKFRNVIDEALAAYMNVLDGYSLRDLMDNVR